MQNGPTTTQQLAAMKLTLRRTNIFVVLAVSAAVLTACASPEEIAATDRRTCAGYGFAQGTDAFANCMMEADQNRKRNQAEQRQRWAEEEQRREAKNQSQTQSARPSHEHCVSAGNSVTTSSSSTSGSTTSSTSGFSNTVCSGR